MILIFISPEISDDEVYELEDIAKLAMDNYLHTEEWMVTIKEKISQEKIQSYVTELKKDHLVERTKHNNVIKYMINKKDEAPHIKVSYEITIPKDQSFSPELVAIIKGSNLSEDTVAEYKSVLKSVRNHFFTKKSYQFTCLIASKNDMIASDDFSNKLSKNLDLKYISTQSDMINNVSYQETIYGYTTLWNNQLIIENKPLNIQVVIQKHTNEKQKVIIGTPILITEY